jgi:hypothetical protein
MSHGGGHDGHGGCKKVKIGQNGHHHGYGGGQGQWHHDSDGQHRVLPASVKNLDSGPVAMPSNDR